VSGELAFVGSNDGNLYAIGLSDGKERWKYETGAPVSASPAIASGVLVIGNEDGLIFCFSGK